MADTLEEGYLRVDSKPKVGLNDLDRLSTYRNNFDMSKYLPKSDVKSFGEYSPPKYTGVNDSSKIMNKLGNTIGLGQIGSTNDAYNALVGDWQAGVLTDTQFDTALKGLNTETQGIASNKGYDGVAGLGGIASDVQSGLSILTGLDSLFGSGKSAKDAALDNLKQSMAFNAEKMAMLRSDRQDFKDNQKRVTDSYFSK